MDKQFLEFWGNYLLAVARGQQQLEDLNRWMEQGFAGAQKLNDLFKAAYELPAKEDDPAAHSADVWKQAGAAFNASLKDYMHQLGWVPRQDYDTLHGENQRLIQKIAILESTLNRMNALLDEKHPGQTRSVRALEEMVQKQTADFNRLMQGLTDALEKTAADVPSKTRNTTKK